MDINNLLLKVNELDASDLIIKAGSPPLLRIYGDLTQFGETILSPEDVRNCIRQVVDKEEFSLFERELELDLAYSLPGVCRFRVNLFCQRGTIGVVFRRVPDKVPTIEELGLPEITKEFAMRPRGLVLVTGPAGCGKSTTQAAMLDYRNEHEECHIVTIEDPIEYLHTDKKALVNQRQVGRDTKSFARALKSVLRQDPDVILVGEMRDLETIALAITAAETGHLVFGTLHTVDAVQTIDRIIDVFPPYQQQQVRMQLSVNLISVISQMLLKRADGKGLVAAFEVMVATPAVCNLIREGKTYQLSQMLQTGIGQGMITMNQSLANLVSAGLVSGEQAMAKSPDPKELRQLLA
jgi:twitching motility protein PilT